MKMFITGATGFIGSNLVDYVMKNREDLSQLTLFVRDSTKAAKYEQQGARVLYGDITDLNSLISAMSTALPDVVIHTAALTNDWAPFSELKKVNVLGTENVVKAIKKIKTNPFLLHFSSSGVYGRIQKPETTIINEDTPLNPKANYQKSKALAEQIIHKEMTHGTLRTTILRPPNVIGPRDFTQFYKIYQAIKSEKFPLIDNGKAIQTWVDVDDLIRAIFLICENQDIAAGKIYNVKSFEITVKELYDLIAAKVNVSQEPKSYSFQFAYIVAILSEMIAKIRRKSSTFNRYRVIKFAKNRMIDDGKIRHELGFSPQVNKLDSLERTINWIKTEEEKKCD
ncbi:MAG: NAD-dependent epimerase/dehydratase family protein [Promethearchaeota archaeon]